MCWFWWLTPTFFTNATKSGSGENLVWDLNGIISCHNHDKAIEDGDRQSNLFAWLTS